MFPLSNHSALASTAQITPSLCNHFGPALPAVVPGASLFDRGEQAMNAEPHRTVAIKGRVGAWPAIPSPRGGGHGPRRSSLDLQVGPSRPGRSFGATDSEANDKWRTAQTGGRCATVLSSRMKAPASLRAPDVPRSRSEYPAHPGRAARCGRSPYQAPSGQPGSSRRPQRRAGPP